MPRHKILTSVVLLALALCLSCGDDGSGPPPVDPPVVTGVTPDTVSPGDTVTVTGSNFSANASENTVTFRNPIAAAKPFEASATQLRVVVDRDATSGVVSVTTAGGTDRGGSLTVVRGVGDVFVFGGVGGNTLTLPNPAGAQYLVVPHGTSTGVTPPTPLGYIIESQSIAPVVVNASAPAAPRKALHAGAHEWFEAKRWADAAALYERYGAPRGEFKRRPVSEAPVLGGPRPFYVLKTTTGDQSLASSYQRINAELRYSGDKCLIYADVDTLPTGNFTQSHFNSFGQAFDNSIDSTNVNYFGGYSDVDGSTRVIFLITPVVNRLEEPGCAGCNCGFIAGFFNPRDLYTAGQVGSGTTNHAEIMYLLAADPTGVWDCPFAVAATAAENLGTITHEHEHLISISHRLFNQSGKFQVTWLEEGMAHMAEDLNGDNSSNESRGTLYRKDPSVVSLEDNEAGLEQRGGIYLMLRLLVDRYGTEILKSIVQSQCTGRACIQNVTGMNYNDLFGEFLAAQYLSGTGITSDDRFNYSSIDINDFGPLSVSLHVAGAGTVTGTVRRSGGEFHLFSGVVNQDTRFRFTDTSGKAGLRHVIVRTQ